MSEFKCEPTDEGDDSLKGLLWATQYDLCAICGEPEKSPSNWSGEPRKLSVDHNHATGQIRDLLCWRCNSTIGKVKEDRALLLKMIAYLDKHTQLAGTSPLEPADGEARELMVRGGSLASANDYAAAALSLN